MEQIKSFIKKPLNWVIIIVVGLILYFLGGIIVKIVVSAFSLWIAYWVSKFTSPYMNKTATRRTVDDLLSGKTNWDGSLKQAKQTYEINKIAGWFMPYLFAVIFIIGLWTTHEDKEKVTDAATVEKIENSNASTNDLITDNVSDVEIEQKSDSKAEESSDLTANWDNNFPTPEYTYTGLLNPQTRDQEKFFADLIEHRFNCAEQFEYTNPTGSLSFAPGTAQDAVFINIYEYTESQRLEKNLNTFFSDKTNCTVDYSGDGTIVITYDYQ